MENPYRALRLREDVTIDELAARFDVTKQSIIRLEQGAFDRPPMHLNHAYACYYDVKEHILAEELRSFQIDTRLDNHRFLGNYSSPADAGSDSAHPFTRWRLLSDLNLTECVKRMCVNQAVLYKWENHSNQQITIPRQVMKALKECGYYPDELDLLSGDYKEYRSILRTRPLVSTGPTSHDTAPIRGEVL